jgi:hypothetical protein
MMIEHEEIARLRIAEQIRAAERHAVRRQARTTHRASGPHGPRHELAGALRRLADRLEPQQHQRRTGLSVVR